MAELSTLARPYARAAFEYAAANDTLDAWASALATLAGIVSDARVKVVLSSPSYTSQQQVTLLTEVYGDQMSSPVANFISVLAENKRLVLIPQIAEQFMQFKANREKSVEVVVQTAFVIEPAIEKALSAALAKSLDRDVTMTSTIDESLIGGAIIRAADVVIDGSIRGRLVKLAEAMNS
jgi:F-type H+-transporting ATPase subunit delta